jgi:hypothetical protein
MDGIYCLPLLDTNHEYALQELSSYHRNLCCKPFELVEREEQEALYLYQIKLAVFVPDKACRRRAVAGPHICPECIPPRHEPWCTGSLPIELRKQAVDAGALQARLGLGH